GKSDGNSEVGTRNAERKEGRAESGGKSELGSRNAECGTRNGKREEGRAPFSCHFERSEKS
ncbi:MAG: hypothetical protein AB1512_24450, partial [Thermodesulfobacteriota bacterium]